MPTAAQCQQRIRVLGRPQMLTLWKHIKAGTTTWWDAGKALEYLILRAFELERATVRWPFEIRAQTTSGRRAIEQIDGVVYADGVACIFECKDHANPMDHDAIAVLRDQLTRRPTGVIGSCVSTSGFTVTALELVLRGRQEIALWTRDDIDYALKEHKMRKALLAKYRWCVERALPDVRLRTLNL